MFKTLSMATFRHRDLTITGKRTVITMARNSLSSANRYKNPMFQISPSLEKEGDFFCSCAFCLDAPQHYLCINSFLLQGQKWRPQMGRSPLEGWDDEDEDTANLKPWLQEPGTGELCSVSIVRFRLQKPLNWREMPCYKQSKIAYFLQCSVTFH